MATTNIEELKLKTWVLKVSIHCERCKRKVIKILSGVEGVYKLDVDLIQQCVMVTGNVEADVLIDILNKYGRHAQLWYQISNHKKQSKSGKDKKKERKNDEPPAVVCKTVVEDDKEKPAMGKQDSGNQNPAKTTELNLGPAGHVNQASKVEAAEEEKLVEVKSDVGSEVNQPASATAEVTEKSSYGESGEENGKVSKKEKRKGQNGNCNSNSNSTNILGVQEPRHVESFDDAGPPKNSVIPERANNIPPRQQPENQHVRAVPVMSYYNMASTSPTTSYYATPHDHSTNNMASSTGPTTSYYANPHDHSTNMPHSPSDQSWYHPSRQPLDSFEMFSDENPNGCSIM